MDSVSYVHDVLCSLHFVSVYIVVSRGGQYPVLVVPVCSHAAALGGSRIYTGVQRKGSLELHSEKRLRMVLVYIYRTMKRA